MSAAPCPRSKYFLPDGRGEAIKFTQWPQRRATQFTLLFHASYTAGPSAGVSSLMVRVCSGQAKEPNRTVLTLRSKTEEDKNVQRQ